MIYRFLLVPLRISWDPPMEGIEWTCMICRVLDCAYAHRCCLIDSEPDLLICWHVLTHVFLKKSGWAQKRCLFWCAKRIIKIYIYTHILPSYMGTIYYKDPLNQSGFHGSCQDLVAIAQMNIFWIQPPTRMPSHPQDPSKQNNFCSPTGILARCHTQDISFS